VEPRSSPRAAQENLGSRCPPPSGNNLILRSNQAEIPRKRVKAVKSLSVVLPVLAILLVPSCRSACEGCAGSRATRRVRASIFAFLSRRLLGRCAGQLPGERFRANRESVHQRVRNPDQPSLSHRIAMIPTASDRRAAMARRPHAGPATAVRRAPHPRLREHVRLRLRAGSSSCCSSCVGPSPQHGISSPSSASRS